MRESAPRPLPRRTRLLQANQNARPLDRSCPLPLEAQREAPLAAIVGAHALPPRPFVHVP